MAANTTSTLARSAFTLAGPVATNTIPPPSEALARQVELHTRIHQAHVRAHIRQMQSSLGLGLPSSMRVRRRSTRAVAHGITTTTHIATTTTPLTSHFPIVVPTPRRPLSAVFLNGLPTPPATPAPTTAPAPQPQPEEAERPLLPTRRSRTRAARTAFHGTGAGLSFGLNVFGDDDPVLTPRAPTHLNGYFQAPGENVTPPPAELDGGEIEQESEEGHEFHAI
ncbi:hypothetical protein V8D89_004718 [Ganoderma adspersum]